MRGRRDNLLTTITVLEERLDACSALNRAGVPTLENHRRRMRRGGNPLPPTVRTWVARSR
jgi:hypothetical protein